MPLFSALLWLTAKLPLPVLHATGSALGKLLLWLPNSLRRIAKTNLGRCLPDLDQARQDQLLKANLQETGKLLLELGPVWYWPRERLLRLIDDHSHGGGLKQLLAEKNSGLILLTPHTGCWELLGQYVTAVHPQLTILYRPSRLPVDALLLERRARFGGEFVGTGAAGVKRLLKTLTSGGTVAILPDQDPGPEGGRFSTFFNQPANTMVLLSKLAIRTRARVAVCWLERLPQGLGYRVHLSMADDIRTPPLAHSLRAMNATVEKVVEALPEQYLWVYRRFRTRPLGH